MHPRPRNPDLVADMFIPPVWNRNAPGDSWDLRDEAGGGAAYRQGGCLITENTKGLQLYFHIPNTNGTKVEFIDSVLHIWGNEKENLNLELARSLTIDTDTYDVSTCQTSLHDGVLLVTVPKKSINIFKWQREEREEGEKVEVAFVETPAIEDERQPADDLDTRSSYDEDDRIIGMTISF